MALDTIVTSSKLTAIADAIRTKGGTSSPLTLDQMSQAVSDLPSGGGGTDRLISAKAAYNYQSDLSYDFLAADFPTQGIRDTAFFCDKYVRDVVFPSDNANAYYISTHMFVGSSVRKVVLPARTDARQGWDMVIRNLTIGGSTSNPGEYFTDCAKLEEVDLSNVVSIARYNKTSFFKNCSQLRSVTFPAGVAWVLGTDDFYSCKKLEKIVLPDSVTTSNQTYNTGRAFYDCQALRVADLGTGIASLHGAQYGSSAFAGCVAMEKLVLRKSDAIVTLSAPYLFSKTSAIAIPQNLVGIYVPDALVDTYKADTNWSAYADYIKPLSQYVDA